MMKCSGVFKAIEQLYTISNHVIENFKKPPFSFLLRDECAHTLMTVSTLEQWAFAHDAKISGHQSEQLRPRVKIYIRMCV